MSLSLEACKMAKLKIYDEDDNFLGEYVGDFIDDMKDDVPDAFSESIGEGLVAFAAALIIKLPWLLLVVVAGFFLMLLWKVVKFLLKCLAWICLMGLFCLWWLLQEILYGFLWLIRLPFSLAVDKEMPDWWVPDLLVPDWRND